MPIIQYFITWSHVCPIGKLYNKAFHISIMNALIYLDDDTDEQQYRNRKVI